MQDHNPPKKVDDWGYMGHLIKILGHITNCLSESEHIAALIASSFGNESKLLFWQSLIDAGKGEFTLAVSQQSKLLTNYNPHEEHEYSAGNSKDFLTEANTWDSGAVVYGDLDNTVEDFVFNKDNEQNRFDFGRNIDDDDDNDDELCGSSGDGHGHGSRYDGGLECGCEYCQRGHSHLGCRFRQRQLCETAATKANSVGAHRASGAMNMTDMTAATTNQANQQSANNSSTHDDQRAEYDNNANVEKTASDKMLNEPNNVETAAIPAAAATLIVSRLQSVLLAGEEDYDDDEGMWTKPLGGSNQSDMATDQQSPPIANGRKITES